MLRWRWRRKNWEKCKIVSKIHGKSAVGCIFGRKKIGVGGSVDEKYTIEVVTSKNNIIPKITIEAPEDCEKIEELLKAVEGVFDDHTHVLSGYSGKEVKLVQIDDIFRIRTEGRKVVFDTESCTYTAKGSLKEIEERMDPNDFCRVSQSEIVNIGKIRQLDLSFSGTVSIELINGDVSYVSRRKIKEVRKHIERYGGKK